eukprot:2246471-Pyramimonas_sp.AAC.1
MSVAKQAGRLGMRRRQKAEGGAGPRKSLSTTAPGQSPDNSRDNPIDNPPDNPLVNPTCRGNALSLYWG